MNKDLINPKTIHFASKLLVKIFVVLIVATLCIFFIVKFELASGVGDTRAELFSYQKTYGELAEVGVSILIADNDEKRSKGLGGFESLRENQTMLFKFDETGSHGFWMKDMNFAIDIIWMDEYYGILLIEENVTPSTYPRTFGNDVASRYVLETRAGFVKEHAVKIGDVLQVL
jgi:hypothetical protein